MHQKAICTILISQTALPVLKGTKPTLVTRQQLLALLNFKILKLPFA